MGNEPVSNAGALNFMVKCKNFQISAIAVTGTPITIDDTHYINSINKKKTAPAPT
jgi:hypothetical protein|nr:MAG TPA: hypothetical protein [Caudoviricetes sp.]